MLLSEIKLNPDNPRTIADDKFKKLVQSLKQFPKMMELRPIVIDENGIIQGGNMRYKALIELKYKEIPGTWIKQAKDFTPDELREFIIKDNIPYGEWDWQLLSDDWNKEQLIEWGLEIQGFDNINNLGEDFNLPDGDKAPFQQMTFTLADQQAEMVKQCLKKVETNGNTYGNENSNGNALHQIVLEWDMQKK